MFVSSLPSQNAASSLPWAVRRASAVAMLDLVEEFSNRREIPATTATRMAIIIILSLNLIFINTPLFAVLKS
jgi:hypothetical protein